MIEWLFYASKTTCTNGANFTWAKPELHLKCSFKPHSPKVNFTITVGEVFADAKVKLLRSEVALQ